MENNNNIDDLLHQINQLKIENEILKKSFSTIRNNPNLSQMDTIIEALPFPFILLK